MELICNLWNHTDHVLFSVCEHLRLYKFQTETKRGEAESRNSTNKSKWKKKSWQGQRWLESTKHRDQVYHIDENHLNSARSPRASTNTRGKVYPVHIHSTGNQTLLTLFQSVHCAINNFATRWKVTVKETSDPRIGSNALAPAATYWGRSQGGGVGRFLRRSQVRWEQLKCLVIHGVSESKSRPSVSGERFEETGGPGSTVSEVGISSNPLTTVLELTKSEPWLLVCFELTWCCHPSLPLTRQLRVIFGPSQQQQ